MWLEEERRRKCTKCGDLFMVLLYSRGEQPWTCGTCRNGEASSGWFSRLASRLSDWWEKGENGRTAS
jgi:ribosomal protein S27AE